MVDKDEIMICACNTVEHQIVFTYSEEEDKTTKNDPMVYMSIFLNEKPFYKRIINAIKYIFGYKCRYGHFDEFIINKDNVGKLKDVVNYIEQNG